MAEEQSRPTPPFPPTPPPLSRTNSRSNSLRRSGSNNQRLGERRTSRGVVSSTPARDRMEEPFLNWIVKLGLAHARKDFESRGIVSFTRCRALPDLCSEQNLGEFLTPYQVKVFRGSLFEDESLPHDKKPEGGASPHPRARGGKGGSPENSEDERNVRISSEAFTFVEPEDSPPKVTAPSTPVVAARGSSEEPWGLDGGGDAESVGAGSDYLGYHPRRIGRAGSVKASFFNIRRYQPWRKESSANAPRAQRAHTPLSFVSMPIQLTGDLKDTALWAFAGRDVDELGLRLLRGHAVFSRDWKSDLWLRLKNKHIFISVFLCHPNHPFTRAERRFALLVSCVLGFGLELFMCGMWNCAPRQDLNLFEYFIEVQLLKIAIAGVINGVYDALLEFGLTCPCIQTGVPSALKHCLEAVSVAQLVAQLVGGVLVVAYGIAYLSEEVYPGGAIWRALLFSTTELVIGKIVGLFLVTLLLETLIFVFARKEQTKPDKDEHERLASWHAPSKPKPPFCLCGEKYQGEPACVLWDTFLGADRHFIDLPARAPTYDVEAKLCCWVFWRETAADPEGIPSWFKSDLDKPATRIEKWLRSDETPRMVGQEDTWENRSDDGGEGGDDEREGSGGSGASKSSGGSGSSRDQTSNEGRLNSLTEEPPIPV